MLTLLNDLLEDKEANSNLPYFKTSRGILGHQTHTHCVKGRGIKMSSRGAQKTRHQGRRVSMETELLRHAT
ncbi:unnamed protein product [Caenorhabditis nigoni]